MCVQYLPINEIAELLSTNAKSISSNYIKDWTPFDVFFFWGNGEIEGRCSDLEFVNSVRFLSNMCKYSNQCFTKLIRCVTINLDDWPLLLNENHLDIKERYGYKI